MQLQAAWSIIVSFLSVGSILDTLICTWLPWVIPLVSSSNKIFTLVLQRPPCDWDLFIVQGITAVTAFPPLQSLWAGPIPSCCSISKHNNHYWICFSSLYCVELIHVMTLRISWLIAVGMMSQISLRDFYHFAVIVMYPCWGTFQYTERASHILNSGYFLVILEPDPLSFFSGCSTVMILSW